MKQTVIGIFDYSVDAQMAAQQLMSSGLSSDQIDVAVRGDADKTATIDREHRKSDSRVGNFFRSLFSERHESDKYARVAEHGSVVTVHARSEEEARQAADILDKYGAVDVDERAERLDRKTEEDRLRTDTDVSRNRSTTIPVTEERLHVGKETVDKGGVRLRSRIIERPVEEHLRLREEHLHVERHPVNRPATEKDITNFKEGEIEIVEHAEIPVVNKEARVVEEIDLTRETSEHDETIRDTVRRQDVDIKEVDRDRDLRNPDAPRDPKV